MFLNRLHCWLVCNVEHESYTLISFQDGKIKFPSSTMSKLLLTKLKVHSEAVLELSVIWHDLHQRTESLSCLLTFYSEHFKDLKVELQSSLFCPLKEQLTKQSHFKVHSAAVLQLHHMIINCRCLLMVCEHSQKKLTVYLPSICVVAQGLHETIKTQTKDSK